jgi:transcriptional regulator with XRE-family HTH domain
MSTDNESMEKNRSKSKPIRRRVESSFAKNLKTVMDERGINLKGAAELAGVSPSVVHAWLQGGSPADLGAVAKLANALKCDFQWLLTGTRSTVGVRELPLSELFDIQDDPTFSGLFLVEAKRLKKRT